MKKRSKKSVLIEAQFIMNNFMKRLRLLKEIASTVKRLEKKPSSILETLHECLPMLNQEDIRNSRVCLIGRNDLECLIVMGEEFIRHELDGKIGLILKKEK